MQEGSLSCHAHRDTGPRFLRSRPKDLSVGRRIKSHKNPMPKTGREPGTFGLEALCFTTVLSPPLTKWMSSFPPEIFLRLSGALFKLCGAL